MNPEFATLLFICGIAGLFALGYDRNERTSGALWLPVLWLAIAGSRPVSVWLQLDTSADMLTEGSPLDRAIFSGLLAAGVLVLMSRGSKVLNFLKANLPIVVFVLYCAISILWSDYPDIAFKRWTKSLGDFVMIMIVLTDRDWMSALKRLITRIGFVLVPLSILFIKYYPALGRAYNPFEGTASYIGVAEDKNMLGKICLVLGLGFFWALSEEWYGARRTRVLLPLGSTLLMILWLFLTADSLTSVSCFGFGVCLMLGTRVFRKRSALHLMVATVILVSFAVLFLNVGQFLLQTIGRNPTLTGRTELWSQLREMHVDPILGTGFESFWLGKRLEHLWSLHWWHPTEAHNGYLEVLLNLGWVGLILLGLAAWAGYRNILQTLDRDPSTGRIRLAYFVVGIAYNYTESAIRTLDPVWFIFVLSLFAVPKLRSLKAIYHTRATYAEWEPAQIQTTVGDFKGFLSQMKLVPKWLGELRRNLLKLPVGYRTGSCANQFGELCSRDRWPCESFKA
jgi:exopolysaccharide production protein ExoQ